MKRSARWIALAGLLFLMSCSREDGVEKGALRRRPAPEQARSSPAVSAEEPDAPPAGTGEVVPAGEEAGEPNESPSGGAPEQPEEEGEAALVSGMSPVKLQQEEAAVEEELLRLINQARREVGARELRLDGDMRFAARIRAQEVVDSLSHTRPDGTAYHTVLDEVGYPYAGKFHGENVIQLQAPQGLLDSEGLAERIYGELRDSAGHYSNLLRDTFEDAGIGVHIVYSDGRITLGCAQLFAGG